MDLSIIIVNWNTRDLLAQCLQSVVGEQSSAVSSQTFVARRRPLAAEVFVVDNASTDGSADMVRERFPAVRLIASPENLGFARGNNLALKHATGTYVLLLNPDTVASKDAIHRLYTALSEHPTLGAVGAQLLDPDGGVQESWGAFPSLWTELPLLNRLTRRGPYPFTDAGKEVPDLLVVDWASGAALMIRRQVLEQIGVLDEDYWLYTEEADWCYRARRAGWKIALLRSARVVHVRRAASRQKFVETALHFHHSRLVFFEKHRGHVQAGLAKSLLCLKAVIWIARPAISPLARAFPELSAAEVRRANHCLLRSV